MFEKTYFVLAPSFHGATLLAKLLNAHPEVTTLGDTYPSNAFDQTCGCREPVSRCPFWQAVKTDTRAGKREEGTGSMLPRYPGEGDARMSSKIAHALIKPLRVPTPVLRASYGREYLTSFGCEYAAFQESVNRHTKSPGRVFIDGVKSISRYEALLAGGTPIDGVIHLRRDPVDFVASSIRNTGRGGWAGIVQHALRHRLYHARARQASRHAKASITLSYEGLADDIDGELERLFRFMGVAPVTLAELRPYFDQEWHFMGNASLFGFDGVIRRSRHRLPRAQERLIRAITGAGA